MYRRRYPSVPRRYSSGDGAAVFALIALAVFVVIALLLVETGVVIVLLGIAHSADERIPALGYAAVLPLVVALDIILLFSRIELKVGE